MINNQDKETNLNIRNNIKPLHKSKRTKIYLAIGIISIIATTAAIASMRLRKEQVKNNQLDNTQTAKIENPAPKSFDKLPEIEQLPAENIQASNTINTLPNIDIEDSTNNKITNEELYNSPLCDNCDNKQTSITENNQSNQPTILRGDQESKNNFEELEPAKLQASKANIIKNPEFIIAKGAFLDAILETRIDSTLKGMVSAILANDVYSMDGSILLLEKGSKITGQYNSDLKEGTERLMVVWDRLRTPNGIIIDLNSFGTDSLGGSGLNGHINHQYGKKFSAAILLSLLDDSLALASKNNNITNNIQNTQQNTRSIAEQALSNSINIPPILYKNQGEHINIFVARDLDFSDVYKLKIRKS